MRISQDVSSKKYQNSLIVTSFCTRLMHEGVLSVPTLDNVFGVGR